MNNLKKIGLTALAGSLVATSVFAGEMTVTGSASFETQHVSGGAANAGKAWSMGNQLDFNGSGELDNGMTVSLYFQADQGASADTSSPFDNHNVKVAHDSLGSLTFHGHGGSTASGAVDDVATGDLWDNGFGIVPAYTSGGTNNMLSYNNSSMVDGLSVTATYVPNTTAAAQFKSTTDVAVQYTGIDGLTVGYAIGEDGAAKGSVADVDTWHASYAYGPLTLKYTATEYDSENTGSTIDRDYTAYNLSYTVTENISVDYGVVEIETPNDATDVDVEVSGITASYTSGGMTIKGKMLSASNTDFSTNTLMDKDMWELGASFAF